MQWFFFDGNASSSHFAVSHPQVSSSFECESEKFNCSFCTTLSLLWSLPAGRPNSEPKKSKYLLEVLLLPCVWVIGNISLCKSVVLDRVRQYRRKYFWFADACSDLFLLAFSFIFALTNVSPINLSSTSALREVFFSMACLFLPAWLGQWELTYNLH